MARVRIAQPPLAAFAPRDRRQPQALCVRRGIIAWAAPEQDPFLILENDFEFTINAGALPILQCTNRSESLAEGVASE